MKTLIIDLDGFAHRSASSLEEIKAAATIIKVAATNEFHTLGASLEAWAAGLKTDIDAGQAFWQMTFG